MAVQTLQSDLLSVFLAMNNITENGNRYMADNVAAKIKAYILTLSTSTTDTGTAPAGAYAGKGSGTMTIDDSSFAVDLYSTFVNGKDNNDFASRMAADIDKACSAQNTVAETSTGIVTTSSGATSAFSGAAQGKFSGNKAVIESKLKSCFSAMDSMTSGGNEYFAKEFALAVESYLKAGHISVTLKPPFVVGSGEGKLV